MRLGPGGRGTIGCAAPPRSCRGGTFRLQIVFIEGTVLKEEARIEQHVMKRAFELAEAGECETITELKKQLKAEDYVAVEEHLSGPFTQGQLKALMSADARNS